MDSSTDFKKIVTAPIQHFQFSVVANMNISKKLILKKVGTCVAKLCRNPILSLDPSLLHYNVFAKNDNIFALPYIP